MAIALHYLVGPKRDHGDGAAIGIGELDLVRSRGVVEDVNDGSYRTRGQLFTWPGLSELDHVAQLQPVILPRTGL
nr:hypothetical protein [Micromonospora saelicesensis]